MRNRYLENFDNIIKIKIEGKNIDNYIKRLIKRKINIVRLIPISYKEVHLIIKLSEYQKLIKYKSTYRISIIDNYGTTKLKSTIKKNTILIISMIIGLILIITLSKLIFTIDIIHEDKEIRTILKKELENYGIKKYTFKKNYQTLESIEDKILKNNKDKLEWIEIIESGTKYIIRVEERKIKTTKKNTNYQSIISTKNAIITKIIATSGEKVKTINDYVKKGDTIISGYITHPDNTTTITKAQGKVYGEVWYKVSLDYPFVYQEENLTGKIKNIYVLNFLNKRFSILDFDKYKSFKPKDKILLSNNLLNISLIKEKQYELTIKDEVYPEDIAITKAKDYISKKLKKDNPNIKNIKKITIISNEESESKLKLKLFITVIENIGTPKEITEEDLNNQPKEN
jgi:similar to stage IV sporulation protein